MVFDGKEYARKLKEQLVLRIKLLPRSIKLVAVVDPKNLSGMKYVQLKQNLARELGVDFEVHQLSGLPVAQIGQKVVEWSSDEAVDGIMIQMPFTGSEELIPLIDPKKDVDGLRDDSPYIPAAVRAVKEVLSASQEHLLQKRMVVVGSRGEVGRKLMKSFPGSAGIDKNDNFEILEDADVVISATGQAGLIKPEMVKEGVIAIDVGYPKGDFDPKVAEKASFFTPVPGGVGPVTVVCLFMNLLEWWSF